MATRETDDVENQIKFHRSVRGKMSLLVVCVILITSVLLTAIDYVFIRANIRDEIHIELQLLNESLRGLVQGYLKRQSQYAQLIIAHADLQRQLGDLVDASISSKEFQEIVNSISLNIRDAAHDIKEIRIADLTGTTLVSTDPTRIGEDLSNTEEFKAGLSDVHIELNTLSETVSSSLSAPIKLKNGSTGGVVIIDIDTVLLLDSLNTLKTGHPSTRIRLANRDSDGKVHYLFASTDMDEAKRGENAIDDPLKAALDGESGFLENPREYRNESVIAAFMPIGYRDWVVVTQVDESDAYSTINETFYIVVIFGTVFSILGAAAATLGVNHLLGPINRLAEATKRIASGEYSLHVHTKRRDEVGSLAQALNSMSDQVAIHTEELESTVAERTGEVERSRDELRNVIRKLEGQTDLMQRDLRRAEAFQKSLLPKVLPQLNGFSVSALYRPGRILGGDLYDVVELDKDHIAMLVADAAGHGASAAMLSVLFKLRFGTPNKKKELLSPRSLFARVNDAIVEDVSAPGVFVTALVCIVNTRTRDVVISSAGHPPLLVVRASGETEEVTRTGPALGLQHDATYGERHINLISGDCLLLYTDGVFDVGDAKPPALDNLVEIIRNRNPNEPVLRQLIELGSEGVPLTDRDDTTLLMLEVGDQPNWTETDTSVDDATDPQPIERANEQVRYIEQENLTIMYLIGRVTWLYGQAFFDAATSVADAYRPLLIEMKPCTYLDSAMLGTLYEVVEYARQKGCEILLQNTSDKLRQAFEELGLTDVLNHIADTPVATPSYEGAVILRAPELVAPGTRLLHSHEVLADLNEGNREEFAGVIEGLREDMTNASSE